MKITALILASAITAAPPVLEPAAIHIEPGLEAAIQEAYDAGAREKCGRAI